MELIHEFDVAGSLKPPVVFGSRMFLEIAEGKVSGERLNGTLLSGGGDWIVLGADGWGQVDVRGQIETDDGAYIYTHYTGLLELNDKVLNATTTGTGDRLERPILPYDATIRDRRRALPLDDHESLSCRGPSLGGRRRRVPRLPGQLTSRGRQRQNPSWSGSKWRRAKQSMDKDCSRLRYFGPELEGRRANR